MSNTVETRTAELATLAEVLNEDTELLAQTDNGLVRIPSLFLATALATLAEQNPYQTWSELEVITAADGDSAQVIGDPSGTHVDPVKSGSTTVDNNGIYLYRDPTGWEWITQTISDQVSADAATATAAAAAIKNHLIILNPLNTDGRLLYAEPEEGGIVPADGLGVVYQLKVPGDKTVGSASIQIDGWAGPFPIYEKDGVTAIPTNRWLSGDTIRVMREPAGYFTLVDVNRFSTELELDFLDSSEAIAGTIDTKPPNAVSMQAAIEDKQSTSSRAYVSSTLQNPSAARPVRVHKIENHRIIISVRTRDADYRDGYVRYDGDLVEFELMNIADKWTAHAGMTSPNLWVLNGIWSVFGGIRVAHSNFLWNDLVGSDVETGRSPSTFEFAQFLGLPATSISAINAGGGSGPYHGDLDVTNLSMVVTDGILDGVLLAASTNVINLLEVGDVMYCDTFDLQYTIALQDPGGDQVATSQPVLRFGGGFQALWLPQIAYSSSPGCKVTFGYLSMLPLTGVNKIQAYAGSAGSVLDIGTTGSHNLGQATRVAAWHSEIPGRAIEIHNNEGYAPFRRDGTQASWTGLDAFLLMDSVKSKFYQPSHASSLDSDDESGNTLTGYFQYRVVRADGV